MWFFLAVLLLWGTTSILGRQDEFILPPLVQWGWWTASSYLCGVAAIKESFTSLQDRLMGLFGFTMFVLYQTSQVDTVLDFLPTDASNPDLWPTVFLAVNLLGPVLLVCAGCMKATVQRGR